MTQADFLKARLDLLKIILSAILAGIFLLLLYIVQNQNLMWPQILASLNALFGIVFLASLVVVLGIIYDRDMKELKKLDEKGNIVIEKREAVMPSETTQETNEKREFYRTMMEITISFFAAFAITKDLIPGHTVIAFLLAVVFMFVIACFWRFLYYHKS